MSNCCHRCNYHLEALARSAQCNIPVPLLIIHLPPTPLPPGRYLAPRATSCNLRGLQQRSQAGKETSERLGNLSVSLDFYLFPLASRISINRNFPLLSKKCVIGAASLMSLRRLLEVLAFFSQEIGPRRRRLHGGKARFLQKSLAEKDPLRSTCLPQERAER